MLPIINLQAVNRTAHTEYMGAPKKKRRVTTTIICWNSVFCFNKRGKHRLPNVYWD